MPPPPHATPAEDEDDDIFKKMIYIRRLESYTTWYKVNRLEPFGEGDETRLEKRKLICDVTSY